MGIGIQGLFGVGVAEMRTDGFDAVSLGDQKRSAGVAKVVNADFLDPGFGYILCEAVLYRSFGNRVLAPEYEGAVLRKPEEEINCFGRCMC